MRKNQAVLLLILIVILGLANYFGPYNNIRNPETRSSAFLPMPPGTIEPTIPLLPFQPPSQQEPSESSDPTSPLIITPSVPVTSTQPIPNLKLNAYSLESGTNQFQPLTAINWSNAGPIIPGQSRNSSRVYFRNEGDVPVTLLLSTLGWIFQDPTGKVLQQDYKQYFLLSWDYDNSAIAINETRPVTFTLTVSPTILDVARFSFGILVTLSY